MTYINQDPEEGELTTEKGCFNCGRFKNCIHIASEKRQRRDFKEIFYDQPEPYVYGCSCDDYKTNEPKERVQFT